MPQIPNKLYRDTDARTVQLLVGQPSAPQHAVPKSALDDAISTVRAQLESAYQAADSAQDTALATQLATINSAISGLQQGFNRRATVKGRFVGTKAELDLTSGALPGVVVEVYPVVGGNGPETLEDLLRYCVLLDASGADSGIYYQSQAGTFSRSPLFDEPSELAAGTLVYVDQGANENTFWLIADTPDGGTVNIIPFGRVQDLTADAAGFISVVANQINTSLNADYLAVSGGALTLSGAFLLQISDLQDSVTGLLSDVSGLLASVNALTSRVTTAESNITALQDAVTNLSAVVDTKVNRSQVASFFRQQSLTGGVWDGATGDTTFYSDVAGATLISDFAIIGAGMLAGGSISVYTEAVINPTSNTPSAKVVFAGVPEADGGVAESFVNAYVQIQILNPAIIA